METNVNNITKRVGAKIKIRRNKVGITQAELGERVGVTFQQIQKYEKGTNTINISKLDNVARILGVPITYFFSFDDTDGELADVIIEDSFLASQPSSSKSRALNRDSVSLMNYFNKIKDKKMRSNILGIVRRLSFTYNYENCKQKN